jgi:hypothetical protein
LREFRAALPFELNGNHERFVSAFEKKANLNNMQAQQIDVAANTSVTSQLSFASVSGGKSPYGELFASDGTFKSKNANGQLQ